MSTEQDWHKPVGIALALASSAFIGSSFIIKKKDKGDYQTNALGHKAGQSHAYLKNYMWWLGMLFMAIGEVSNFGAYAFVPAIIVTPLGAVSVVLRYLHSSTSSYQRCAVFDRLKGAARLLSKGQCLLGALIIVLNAPDGNSTTTIISFFNYLVQPGFLSYAAVVSLIVLYLIFKVAPIYGEKQPVVYIAICSLVGSFLVISTQGFGSAVVYSASNWTTDNQFLHWQLYLVVAVILATIVIQINYLNKALNLFSTAIVSPVYYVCFTITTIVTSAVFFKGFHNNTTLGLVMMLIGFFVIVSGVSLLFQYNLTQRRLAKLGLIEAGIAGSNEILHDEGEVSSDNILMHPTRHSADFSRRSRRLSNGTMNRGTALDQSRSLSPSRSLDASRKRSASVGRGQDSIMTTRDYEESVARTRAGGLGSADGFLHNRSEEDLR